MRFILHLRFHVMKNVMQRTCWNKINSNMNVFNELSFQNQYCLPVMTWYAKMLKVFFDEPLFVFELYDILQRIKHTEI